MGCRHQRDLLVLRIVAPNTIKVRTNGGRSTLCLPGSFSNQATNNGCTFPRDMPQLVPVSGLVLAGDEPKLATNRFGIAKPIWIIDERRYRLRRANVDARDTLQQGHTGSLPSPSVQLLFETLHLRIECLDFFHEKIAAQLLRLRGECQTAEPSHA